MSVIIVKTGDQLLKLLPILEFSFSIFILMVMRPGFLNPIFVRNEAIPIKRYLVKLTQKTIQSMTSNIPFLHRTLWLYTLSVGCQFLIFRLSKLDKMADRLIGLGHA